MSNHSPFGQVALILGPEGLLAERAVASFVAAAASEQPDATVSQVRAADLDRGALAEITGGSLFAETSIAIVDELSELPSDLVDQLAGLAEAPAPEVALALVHNGGAKGKALLDRLRKAKVAVVDCPAVKSWELPQFTQAEVRRRGGTINGATASFLVEAVGTDLRTIAGAVAQLVDDTEGGAITDTVVRRYFGGRAEVTSFAVADDSMAGNHEAALGKLRWAVSTGVAPVLITSALASSLRSLGKYLDARDARVRDFELARTIGVPVFRIKTLAAQSRDWSPRGIARGLQAVATADAAIKGAASDPVFALEQVVLTVISCRGRSS